jgi:hypothetical protein
MGFYLIEFFGFTFMALVPAIFIFTIWAIESNAFPMQTIPLARLDRYGVMFLFMGAWWQVFMFAALRARRMGRYEARWLYLWAPFLALGTFISLLILWVSPWNLKWVSVIWFFMLAGLLSAIRAGAKTVERTMWVLSALIFIAENIGFLWLESVV